MLNFKSNLIKVISLQLIKIKKKIKKNDLFLDAILFTQFVCKITEGGARKETWSSANYLFFISTYLIYGKNQQARQGIVWPKDLKSVLGPEISRVWGIWFKMLVTI